VLLRNPFTKFLWDARRSLPGWTVAIVAVALMYAAFWPTMNSPEMASALKAYPPEVLDALNAGDLTTPQGYLGGAVYGLLVPLLVAVFMITMGARSVAGDEEAGTLDLVLAHPVSRRGLALQRLAGMLTSMAATAVVVFAVMVALRTPFELDGVALRGFVAINLQLALFGMLFGALAFAIGAAIGTRTAASRPDRLVLRPSDRLSPGPLQDRRKGREIAERDVGGGGQCCTRDMIVVRSVALGALFMILVTAGFLVLDLYT
jgi:ABC-2 type transport system permease protein